MRVGDGAAQVRVRNNTLWRARDVKLLIRICVELGSQFVHQIRVVGVTPILDIQIETVNDSTAKRSGIQCFRGILLWSVGTPEKISKVPSRTRGGDRVASPGASSQRYEDLFAGILTCLYICGDLSAVLEHLRLRAVWCSPIGATTCVAIVGSRISIVARFVGEGVDKGDRDDINC